MAAPVAGPPPGPSCQSPLKGIKRRSEYSTLRNTSEIGEEVGLAPRKFRVDGATEKGKPHHAAHAAGVRNASLGAASMHASAALGERCSQLWLIRGHYALNDRGVGLLLAVFVVVAAWFCSRPIAAGPS